MFNIGFEIEGKYMKSTGGHNVSSQIIRMDKKSFSKSIFFPFKNLKTSLDSDKTSGDL